MKKTVKIVSLLVCILVFGGVLYALAADPAPQETEAPAAEVVENDAEKLSKNETVYVLAGADGSVQKIIVSDWIKNTLNNAKINDVSELSDVETISGDAGYTLSADNMRVWDAQGNDIYYQGVADKALPVQLSVKYKLNGESISPDQLAGKSGKVTICFDYINTQYEYVEIDGAQKKIYVPFVMLTGMLLDNDTFENVEVTNGKLINDGDRTAIIGFAMPGLAENLNIDKEKLEIPQSVQITADVKDFKLGMTVTVATNEIFNRLDSSRFDSVDGLNSSMDTLTDAMRQLMDGSSQLCGGLYTLMDKSEELVAGIDKLAAGADRLQTGSKTLASGLNTLSSKNAELNGGAKQVFETLLKTAQQQLTAAGVNVPQLTVENYAQVLNNVIASLDETSVYNQALAQVTQAVNEKRLYIEAQVTAAVQSVVRENVIRTATGLDPETYSQALAVGKIDAQTQAAIENATNMQMQQDAVKAQIVQNTQLEIEKAIAENMAGAEVQQKLSAASEGAKSVISLKTSLDSYNTFYLGLQAYTSGVSQSADGAAALEAGVGELYNGILTLQNGVPALRAGVSQLYDGAEQLSDGLKKLNREGIQKLVDAVDGDLNGLVIRLRATVDVSKEYRAFSGISDEMSGQVKFIYRTESI